MKKKKIVVGLRSWKRLNRTNRRNSLVDQHNYGNGKGRSSLFSQNSVTWTWSGKFRSTHKSNRFGSFSYAHRLVIKKTLIVCWSNRSTNIKVDWNDYRIQNQFFLEKTSRWDFSDHQWTSNTQVIVLQLFSHPKNLVRIFYWNEKKIQKISLVAHAGAEKGFPCLTSIKLRIFNKRSDRFGLIQNRWCRRSHGQRVNW